MNYAIINAARLNRVHDAIRVFDTISTMGYTPDLMSYNNIIWAVGHAGREDLAVKYWDRLKEDVSLTPNIYSYGAIMHAFAKSKNYRRALQLLDQLDEKNVSLNLVVFSSAMDACAGAGKVTEALSVLTRAEKSGVKPDAAMYNTAIKACSQTGAMRDAEDLAK